jgi:TPR repeat protein
LLKICHFIPDGIGVRANDAQAVVLLTRAHEQKHLGATFALGLYLLHGTRGLAANPPLGCQYVEQACAAGDLDATVLWADIMLHGKYGAKANAPLAVRLLHKSATQSKHVESAYQLAQCYYHGTGTPKNWSAAYQWYSFAFDHGHIGAVHRIACFMRTGEGGVVVNTSRALELFKRAADAGHPDAQYDLGMLYYQGIGVPQNLELAVDFMTIASRHGNSNAMVTVRCQLVPPCNTPSFQSDFHLHSWAFVTRTVKVFLAMPNARYSCSIAPRRPATRAPWFSSATCLKAVHRTTCATRIQRL